MKETVVKPYNRHADREGIWAARRRRQNLPHATGEICPTSVSRQEPPRRLRCQSIPAGCSAFVQCSSEQVGIQRNPCVSARAAATSTIRPCLTSRKSDGVTVGLPLHPPVPVPVVPSPFRQLLR